MTKNKLYKPVIVKKQVDDEHYYFVDDKFMPGVTKILQESLPMPFPLRYWIGEVGNEKAQAKLEKAGDRGSRIHDACERLLKGETVDLESEFPEQSDKKALVGFANWVAAVQPKVEKTEFTVASQLGYAGTLDLFCYIDDEPWIIDFKTSKGIYESHKLQIAAYKNAFREMTGIDANMGILHLNYRTIKGWTFHSKIEIKKKPVEIGDFINVMNMYKMLNGGEIPEPNLKDVYPDKLRLEEVTKSDS